MRRRGLGALATLLFALLLGVAPAPMPAAAEPAVITLTLDRGEGGAYAIGDPVAVSYTLPHPGTIKLLSIAGGNRTVVAEAFTSSTSDTITTTVGRPEGRHTVRLELYAGRSSRLVASAETYLRVGSAEQIGCNASVTGRVGPGGQDQWTFAGSSGSRVSASATGPVSIQLALQGPDGTPLASGVNSLAETTLGADGTYTLLVSAVGPLGPRAPASDYTLQLTCTSAPPAPPPGGSATYRAGWNLVGGPNGTLFPVTLYRFDPASGTYRTVAPSMPVQAGQGYWAYFGADTTVSLIGPLQRSVTITVPALQWVQIANPSAVAWAQVTGADAVYTYDPAAGRYTDGAWLAPGTGAWALKTSGGAITVAVP